jgi:SAM-dependent methyltransferase
MRLAVCASCGFITNVAFRPELLEYGDAYENDQTHSTAYTAHSDTFLTLLLEQGVRNKFVMEVGCGQGQFLKRLCAEGPNRGVGFDPAYRGPDTLDGVPATFVRELLCGQVPREAPDLLVCRHVLEHVADPMLLLQDVRAALGRSARLAFEMRTVDWILEQTIVQDLYYEHCSYFTPDSLRFAFERAGFTNFKATRAFGGQYMWATADWVRGLTPPTPRPTPGRSVALAERYRLQEVAQIASLRSNLERLRASGPVAVWGAGAKGVTYLNVLDPECVLVACAVDINSRKQGRYVAGTGHPIICPDQLRAHGVSSVVVMNPNYVDEVRAAIHGAKSRTIDIEVVGQAPLAPATWAAQ